MRQDCHNGGRRALRPVNRRRLLASSPGPGQQLIQCIRDRQTLVRQRSTPLAGLVHRNGDPIQRMQNHLHASHIEHRVQARAHSARIAGQRTAADQRHLHTPAVTVPIQPRPWGLDPGR